MRSALALLTLALLGACAAQPSPSASDPQAAFTSRQQLIEQDAQAILYGMEHAHSTSERIARSQ